MALNIDLHWASIALHLGAFWCLTASGVDLPQQCDFRRIGPDTLNI